MPTECEVCNHPCYNIISPPPCLQCTRCRVRCHKQHYDDGEFIQPCRGKIIRRRKTKKLIDNFSF
jgi:hypothetical protein